MTIAYDPHQNIGSNVQHGERHTINVGQQFRVVVPTHAPFYYNSLKVYHNANELTENVHYYVSHRYMRGTHQTGRICHGSIWIIDKNLGGDVTVDYHPLGINEATAQEISDERTRNAAETPSDLDWEEIVGVKYFPPVNIQFERDDWHGETEIINSIKDLGDVLEGGGWPFAVPHTSQNSLVDAAAKNIAPEPNWAAEYSTYCVKKTIDFTGQPVDFTVFVDNNLDVYVDGVKVFDAIYPTQKTERVTIPAGKRTIAMTVRNGTGQSLTNFKIQEVGKLPIYSDATWRCSVLGDELSLEDAVRPIGGGGDVYGILDSWYKALKSIYELAPAHAHVLDHANPHGEEYGWIYALEKGGVAKNATKAFNKTLAELTTYVNARAPTTADLSGKVSRNGDLLLGKMIMQEGMSAIASSTGTGYFRNMFRILNNSIDFTTIGSVTATAGKTTNQPVTFKAGENILKLYPDARLLEFNGSPVLSKDNVAPHVPVPDGVGSNIHTETTVTVSMGGAGTAGDKLAIEWRIPEQSSSSYTMRPLASTFGSSKANGAKPSLVKQVADVIPTKLTLANARINGRPLNNSVFLNPIDFGLGNVANLSDADLPISTLQQAHLDKYIVGAHTHKLSDFGYGAATATVAGVFNLLPFSASTDDAVRSQDVREQHGRVPELASAIDNLMPAGVITVLRYGVSGSALITDVTVDGYLFTINNTVPYYCDGLHTVPATTFNLIEMFPSMGEEQTLYIFVNRIGDKAMYEVYDYRKVEDDSLTEVGHVVCTDVGIDSYQLRNVTRLGEFRELDEHRLNASAHMPRPSDRNDLGLGSFVNAEIRYGMTKPTFQQIFDTWPRFSHGAAGTTPGQHTGIGNVQPANPTENDSWTYDVGTDAVVQPVNTGSFCGFISPTKHEKYEFDTVLQSNAADNDLLGVVIGFAVDDSGRERTLSWSCRQDNVLGAGVGYCLAIDYNQTDQIYTDVRPVARYAGVPTWNATGGRRVRVVRDGDNFVVETYVSGDAKTIEETYHFNLTTGVYIGYANDVKIKEGVLSEAVIARLAIFRGAQPFGYCCQSQPNSTYVNIKRPDEDGENFYSSVPELIDTVSPFGTVRIYKGRSSDIIGRTRAQIAEIIPPPLIQNYLGQTIVVPPERISFYTNGDNWTMVCHVDATVLHNNPT